MGQKRTAQRGFKVIVAVDGIAAQDDYYEQYTVWHLGNATVTCEPCHIDVDGHDQVLTATLDDMTAKRGHVRGWQDVARAYLSTQTAIKSP